MSRARTYRSCSSTRMRWVRVSTVSSKRTVGTKLGGRPQIWMFAINPQKLAAGEDGSYPAFWLPFQNTATNNHIAQWTTRIVPIGFAGDDAPAAE